MSKNDALIDSLFELSREKNLDISLLLQVVEDAIKEVIGKSKGNIPIDVKIHPDSGCISTYAIKTVSENPEDIYEISLEDALKQNPDSQIGDHVKELLESGNLTSMPFMRTAASAVRKSVHIRISQLEKEREFASFEHKEGTIVSAKIKRFEFGNVVLDLKIGEGYLPSSELIAEEHFKMHQEIKAYIYQVKNNEKGPQIFLSRKHPGFLECLFEETIPEINESIFIKGISREPGSKAKVAVISTDEDIDPIGSCIGKGGLRIKTIMQEINDEKIDVIHWSEDVVTLVMNSIYPAEVVKVVVKGDADLELIVKDDYMHIAIGRDGQNVRLTRKLARCRLKISSETEHAEETKRIAEEARKEFTEFGLDEENIELFIENGITSLEVIKNSTVSDIEEIEGITLSYEGIQSIIDRAYTQHMKKHQKIAKDLGSEISSDIDHNLLIEEVSVLAQNGILTDEDLANLSADEMMDFFDERFSKRDIRRIEDIIMSFRRVTWEDESYIINRDDEDIDDENNEHVDENDIGENEDTDDSDDIEDIQNTQPVENI
ncbi:transcription termination factor NusA [Candidatus Cytomitobacter primus]|uniref:Transcription termination/antitermination protein NusA n=1 Tax=Candidatus Cytomitobacter primus TaxID=2066024 RepID=A0A5C0UEG2_9PROT|nr:transcription termination factor NusA [Candidatus Cytomitobacter primus]QEK38438.1 transcription termination factor NusA [Candidatus Cytomitobacter primus]